MVDHFNRTIKVNLHKLMVRYNTQNWAALSPEAFVYDNFQFQNCCTGQTSAQVDIGKASRIPSQKAQETVQMSITTTSI